MKSNTGAGKKKQKASKWERKPLDRAPEVVNKRGDITTERGTTLHGMDHDIYLKSKEDPAYVRAIAEWLEKASGKKLSDPTDLQASLKDGIVLIHTVNNIRPNLVTKWNDMAGKAPEKGLAMRQWENIKLYLDGCRALGVADGDMFLPADLHEGRDLCQVMQNIAALSRRARVHGFAQPAVAMVPPKQQVDMQLDRAALPNENAPQRSAGSSDGRESEKELRKPLIDKGGRGRGKTESEMERGRRHDEAAERAQKRCCLCSILSAVSSAQLCSNQVGTGCSIWTPASASDAYCQFSTIVALNQIIEARVEDNGGSTGLELISTAPGLRLLANATISPASHVCTGCPSTAAFFYEATATGSISIDAVRPWAPSDSRNVFTLGVAVDPAHQAPVCSGGFFGIEASGSTLTVDPNALVEVRLHAAPGSTGYEWIVDPQTPAAAQVVLPCTRFGMGCPQTFVFFFRATQAGQIRVNNARFGVTQSVFSLNLLFPSA
eukprot:m51a1_g6055 hypothetical protein (492) ;mRNA; f:224971-229226